MTERINTIVTGVFGVSLVELTPILASTMPTPQEITEIGQVMIQIAIGIVTLYRLLKGKPGSGNNEQNNTPQ